MPSDGRMRRKRRHEKTMCIHYTGGWLQGLLEYRKETGRFFSMMLLVVVKRFRRLQPAASRQETYFLRKLTANHCHTPTADFFPFRPPDSFAVPAASDAAASSSSAHRATCSASLPAGGARSGVAIRKFPFFSALENKRRERKRRAPAFPSSLASKQQMPFSFSPLLPPSFPIPLPPFRTHNTGALCMYTTGLKRRKQSGATNWREGTTCKKGIRV